MAAEAGLFRRVKVPKQRHFRPWQRRISRPEPIFMTEAQRRRQQTITQMNPFHSLFYPTEDYDDLEYAPELKEEEDVVPDSPRNRRKLEVSPASDRVVTLIPSSPMAPPLIKASSVSQQQISGRQEVPSSQTPPDSPLSTQSRSSPHKTQGQSSRDNTRSPLKERSVNGSLRFGKLGPLKELGGASRATEDNLSAIQGSKKSLFQRSQSSKGDGIEPLPPSSQGAAKKTLHKMYDSDKENKLIASFRNNQASSVSQVSNTPSEITTERARGPSAQKSPPRQLHRHRSRVIADSDDSSSDILDETREDSEDEASPTQTPSQQSQTSGNGLPPATNQAAWPTNVQCSGSSTYFSASDQPTCAHDNDTATADGDEKLAWRESEITDSQLLPRDLLERFAGGDADVLRSMLLGDTTP